MKGDINKITNNQLIFMIIQAQIGVGILSLPHDVAVVAKQDGWISTLIAGLISQAIIIILWLLCRRFPSLSLYKILPKLLGKIIGNIIILFYSLYFMITGSLVLARYNDIIDKWILPQTPNWVTMVLILLTCIYIVSAGLTSIARFYTLVSPVLLLLFILIMYSMKDANFLYILPIGDQGIPTLFQGSKEAAFSMLGFELFLFIHPHVQSSMKDKLKAMTIANTFVTLFYTFMVFAALVYFETNADIALTPEPLLYMIKAYSFQILERTDLFFLSLWLMVVATSIANWLLLSSMGLSSLVKKSYAPFLPLVAGFYLVLALIPDRDKDFESFNQFLGPSHYIFIILIPLLLLISSIVFSKKDEVEET
ncbi:GerAB/ArcD/ProY family transporter [Litchfieldia salsa]|uniref:Spore germination protein (Amino acid permease) n=1 Tax=Litchfieldia salsa TaxID=930152 RepID=A0A1H0PFT4_9BACI|nr:GerAB/ArcD/ProY family transporter [Litchfieldia salsa]SDP03917.1 spore germination protein (amino acid permease) [Litchfieldia salsa]